MSLCSHSRESSVGHWGSRLAFIPLVYNTRLIRINPGYQAAQIRLIFRLHLEDPTHTLHGVLLVYVQWFSKFQESPSMPINMFKVHRLLTGGDRGSPIGDVIRLNAVA